MEVLFDRSLFSEAVQTVAGALSQRAPQAALQCIHIAASGGEATLSATDLRISISRRIEAIEVRQSGVGLIQGTRLAALLREIGDEKILLRMGEARAELRAGRSSFKMVSVDAAEYPELPVFGKATARVTTRAFETAVQRTLFATASEQGRFALDGVSLLFEPEWIELAATDGRRLSVARVEAKVKGKKPRAIVPRKLLAEVRRVAGDAEEMELALDGGRLLVSAGGSLVAGTLIDGTFPDYRDMIPPEGKKLLRVRATEFASRLRQALQVTTEDSRAVSLHISATELGIESKSSTVGEASIEMEAEYNGEPLTISFNPQFLLDGLAEFGEEEVEIEIVASERPAVMRQEGFVYVIAPVKAHETGAGGR